MKHDAFGVVRHDWSEVINDFIFVIVFTRYACNPSKQVIDTGISLLSFFYGVERKLNTSCPLCDSLIKVSQMLYDMLLKIFGFVRYLLPLGRVTHFSVVFCVWCIQDTVYSRTELWLNTKSTHASDTVTC